WRHTPPPRPRLVLRRRPVSALGRPRRPDDHLPPRDPDRHPHGDLRRPLLPGPPPAQEVSLRVTVSKWPASFALTGQSTVAPFPVNHRLFGPSAISGHFDGSRDALLLVIFVVFTPFRHSLSESLSQRLMLISGG